MASPLTDPALMALLERGGVDPVEGLQLIALDRLVARPFDAGMALLVLPPAGDAPDPADPYAALPGRHGHGTDPVSLLHRLYPPEHPIMSVDGADTTIGEVSAETLASGPHLLPAVPPGSNPASMFGLPWLVHRLRQPDGCPWDREQDHQTLKPFLLEETYEVYDALDLGAGPDLAEELGDLLLQIVLHAQYAAEEGIFDMSDVQRAVTTKIIGRHPHVFGDVTADTPDEVIRNWEQLKAAERTANGKKVRSPDMPDAFKGLSRSLPSLAYADEMQARAAALGYDWPDLEGVIDKIAEEATELLAATDEDERREEFGDLLFVLVNMGRKLGIDPEAALRSASRKFAARFARVERLADEQGVELKALGLDALDDLWQLAKRQETIAKEGP
ncbi:MAG: nucleoside triphosphate pyrophosphohydrolase [Chloroflexota bacterium]|jgi:tetrapyrrole methylase family protein/MazG family protein